MKNSDLIAYLESTLQTLRQLPEDIPVLSFAGNGTSPWPSADIPFQLEICYADDNLQHCDDLTKVTQIII